MPMQRRGLRSAFTLIELLVVIAIIAILAIVVVLTLNPAELLRQGRDSNRISDMSTLNSALSLYSTDQSGASSFSLGSSSVVYVSIPDPTASTTAGSNCASLSLPTLPSGYAYHCAGPSYYRMSNGQGWIPVNFSNISAGTPISSLPVDPTNQSSSRLYYTYTTNGSQFEVTANLESQKYDLGGSSDEISGDGAPLATVYAKGSNLTLEPLDYGDPTLVGYWPLNEGTGTVAYDESGNNASGTLSGTTIPTWTTGKFWPYSLLFYGSGGTINPQSYINIGNLQIYSNPAFSIATWFNTVATSTGLDLYGEGGTSGTYGEIYISAGKIGGDYGGGSSGSYSFPSFSSTGTYNNGNWHFMVFVQSSYSSRSLYVDGVQVATNNTTISTQSFNQSDLGALTRSTPGYSWNGMLQNLRIYTRALTVAQIIAMYNGGK